MRRFERACIINHIETFEAFDERGAQMVPTVFLYQIKSKFFPAKTHKN